MILKLILVGLLGVLACTPQQHANTTGRPATISAAAGAPLYSDDELTALQLKVVTDADFTAYPLPSVKLAPQTRVEIFTDLRTIDLKGAIAPYPMTFERLRVLDGPAKGREGWIQAGWAQ